MTASSPSNIEGSLIAGRYRVERLIGRGGMGSVWVGRHLTLKRLVAIKFIHPELVGSEEALRRFDIEAKAAARLKSRHAVAVYDHGVTERGQPYIVMEYLEGEVLEEAIRRRGTLPLPEVADIVDQAARALEAAHEANIVHRDLKPENVFLAREREAGKYGYTVKLVDFGIAKIVQDEAAVGAAATQAGSVLGTPHYMSPEALTASAPVSPASDVWSLGACAFAAVCGRVPFEGEAIGDVVLKVCAAPMPVPSRINARLPRSFDGWFARACARDVKQRFTSVRQMADALLELEKWAQRERETAAYELRAADLAADESPELRPERRGWVMAGVFMGAAAMLGALGYYVLERTRAADAEAARVAASARAVVEEIDKKKLDELEKYSFGMGSRDAMVPDASAARPRGKGRPTSGKSSAPPKRRRPE
ncbi:MAG TPA: serine/threonine-protein kinase [Polyangiaceae bacterium]|nr:serine/threonine-protein kinase [Polyangiaceae bacterium]